MAYETLMFHFVEMFLLMIRTVLIIIMLIRMNLVRENRESKSKKDEEREISMFSAGHRQ